MLLVLAAVAATAYAAPAAYADHPTASVSNARGSSVPGCEVDNECFIPADVTVDVGGEVTWSNDDTAAHTITGGSAKDGPNDTFNSGLVMPDSTFTYTFEEPGEYPYFCVVHPWMAGMVTVAMGDSEDDHGHGDMEMMDGGSATTLNDGTMIKVLTTEPAEGKRMDVIVEVVDSEHVNYDIKAFQNGNVVLDDMDAHDHDGVNEHETAPLGSSDPVTVVVTFQGFGMSDVRTGPVGETYTFSSDSMRATATGMLSDGQPVTIVASDPIEDHRMGIAVQIGGQEHITYDIMATQGDTVVLDEKDAHDHDGLGNHETDVLGSSDPVDIVLTFQGYGEPGSDLTGPVGEQVTFTNIVPEFGTVAAMILAAAIVSIIAVTARSRLSLAPRI